MILPLEGLGAENTSVLALITVRQFVLGESARVVERLGAGLTRDTEATKSCR